jgi:hypothetical protein
LSLVDPLQSSDLAKLGNKEYFEEKTRSLAQRDFVHGLLATQSEHQQLGIQDPRGLYQFSKACSKTSRQRAVEEARRLERQTRGDLIDSINDVLNML